MLLFQTETHQPKREGTSWEGKISDYPINHAI